MEQNTLAILQRFAAWAESTGLQLADYGLHLEMGLGLAHIVAELTNGEKRCFQVNLRSATFEQI